MRSLVKLRELEPALRLGWSVPRVKRDYTRSLLYAVPAYTFLLYARRRLPGVAAGHIAAGRCDAVMCHFKLVTPALLDAVRSAGGELYVWTVDDAHRIRSLEALGVTVRPALDTSVLEDARLLERRPDHLVTLPLQVWLGTGPVSAGPVSAR